MTKSIARDRLRVVGFADRETDSQTDRQQLASDELWEVSSHLDLVLNSLTDHAIITLDLEGGITSWNRGARCTKGYDATEIIGKNFSCFYGPEDQAAGVPQRALAAARENGKHEAEGWRIRKDGSAFWANVTIHPVRDLKGILRGYVKVTRNVSERVNIEKLQEELRQSQKLELVGQLVGGVVHDFSNLLTTIEAGQDLITTQCADEKITRILEFNKDAVGRSKNLISQLLSFSRRQVLVPTASNVYSVISDLDALLQRAVGAQIRLRWNLQPALPKVLVDQAQLQSALLNLVVNAKDSMPNGGWLTIFMDKVDVVASTRRPPFDVPKGEYVVFGVSDTGTGIAPEICERIIEPFFTTKPPGSGAGLGLSQCYGFARQSGGGMEVDSIPHKGTTIRIFLPVASGCANVAVRRRPKTVLFVDDELSIRTLVSEVLRGQGHNVVEAEDAASALKALRDIPEIDYLVTDIIMPNHMNGVELMNAARALRPGLPVLLVSGYPQSDFIGFGQIPEDVMFIRKPYSMADLNAHINSDFDII